MKQTKMISMILFYGAIWGIFEATIGHILHFIPATIAGSIMFPIAGVILYKAYQQTNNRMALMYISIVAASIKSVNFLMPYPSIYKVINPMISILLEAFVVVLVLSLVQSKQPQKRITGWLSASIAWRGLFIAWMGLQYVLTGNLAPYFKDMMLFIDFLLISGVISGVLTVLFVELSRFVRWEVSWDKKPYIASTLFVIACFVTYML